MRRAFLGAVLMVVAGAGVFAWNGGVRGGLAEAAAQGGAPTTPPAVPVTASAAKLQDVPVYLRGIGTVQAVNTVGIRAQVSGTLIAVPVKEGQEVKQGDVLAQIDPRPFQAALDQAMAQRAADQAQQQSAQLDLQRFRALAKQSFAPVQQVDDQLATVNKLAAAIQGDSAAIETAQINLGFTTIRSPINGRVSLFQTDIGNLIEVATQTNIFTITQDKPIETVFTLPEEQFPRVQQAMQKGTLPVRVFTSDGKTQLAEGTLMAPNNTIDTSTGTIALKASFSNDDDGLWPGEFVDAAVLVDTLHNAVTLPVVAVEHGPNGLFVYTVGPNSTVSQQPVTAGYQDGDRVVISSGLKGGEMVVTSGQSRLVPGIRVAVNAGQSTKPETQANATE